MLTKLLQHPMHVLLSILILAYLRKYSKSCTKRYRDWNIISLMDPDIYIAPLSEKIGHTWSHGEIWEKHLIQKFFSLLPANDFFVAFDLGAQTGCFSLLAKYFPNSIWYSFEPIKKLQQL